jgi:DNA-3-methyladenine glycosylase
VPEQQITQTVRRLQRRELPVDTVALARYLIGKTVVRELARGRMSGRVVETEAYLPDDAACHAHRGLTPRNRSLFLDRGHAYLYFIYGMYMMLNVSGGKKGIGSGVLIRALEPLEGINLMQGHRGTDRIADLTRGPGRLAQALKLDLRHDGVDLCADETLWLATGSRPIRSIGITTRIGLSVETDRLLRFYERGNLFVSGPKSLRPE